MSSFGEFLSPSQTLPTKAYFHLSAFSVSLDVAPVVQGVMLHFYFSQPCSLIPLIFLTDTFSCSGITEQYSPPFLLLDESVWV